MDKIKEKIVTGKYIDKLENQIREMKQNIRLLKASNQTYRAKYMQLNSVVIHLRKDIIKLKAIVFK